MAKQAYMLDENGELKLMHSSKLTEAERKNSFYCCGCTPNGETCGTPMQASEETDAKQSYFYQRFRDKPHKPGCSNNRANPKSVVEKLDQRGEGLTTQQLHEKLNRDKVPRKKKRKPDVPDDVDEDNNEERGAENPDEDNGVGVKDEREEKEIQQRNRTPRNLTELIALLKYLKKNDMYADKLVFDQILDERTKDSYKRFKHIPVGVPFIITASKVYGLYKREYIGNNQCLLKDYWTMEEEIERGFTFLLNLDDTAREKLRNLCRREPAVKIMVYGVFHRDPQRSGRYISELIKAHMIDVDTDNDC